MPPLVSILIPAYNAERFITDTLRSAMAQSWPRTEIIVVDDGSRDGTAQRAESFSSKSLKVIRQPNSGAATARNTALSAAQGDFIQWLDADDLLSRDKVREQLMLLLGAANSGAVASCGWAYFRYRPRLAAFTPGPLWEDLAPLEWLLRKWETNSHMQTATWLVSRSLTESIGPWNPALRSDDDGEFFSRVVAASGGVRFAAKARVYYRVSPASRLSYIGDSSEKLEALMTGMQIQIERLRAISDDERAREACTRYVRDWMPAFYPSRPDLIERARFLAASWGGEPGRGERLSWKYDWIRRLLGGQAARYAQLRYNEVKASTGRAWDRTMHRLEGDAIDVAKL